MDVKKRPFQRNKQKQADGRYVKKKPGSLPAKKQDRKELKYYGYHACLNLWKARPDDIIRVYVEQRHIKEASGLLKWCAGKNKAYHVITTDEMAKVSDSVHHEGLCILAKELPRYNFSDLVKQLEASKGAACLLYLDGVQNPHNIGSIMRVCAHFGIAGILGARSSLPNVAPSAYRIAQGGAECVKLIPLDDPKGALKKIKELGFEVVASSSHAGKNLYSYAFAPRTVLVLGAESEGVHANLLAMAKDTLLIPGTGLVESLNVSVACGLFLGEYYRQRVQA